MSHLKMRRLNMTVYPITAHGPNLTVYLASITAHGPNLTVYLAAIAIFMEMRRTSSSSRIPTPSNLRWTPCST